jgi:hypothetical protein
MGEAPIVVARQHALDNGSPRHGAQQRTGRIVDEDSFVVRVDGQ